MTKIDATLRINRLRAQRRLNPTLPPVPAPYTFHGDPAVGDRILDTLIEGYGSATITARGWVKGNLVVTCSASEIPPVEPTP